MAVQNVLKIVHWNCRSLLTKLSLFKLFLYSEKPHLVCLCETWLSPALEPKFINYYPLYAHRPAGHLGGGLAFLIRSDVTHSSLPLPPFPGGHLECAALTVHLTNSPSLSVLNLYNVNHSISSAEFSHYFHHLGSSRIIVGDFNAHHPQWDSRHPANRSGTNLFDTLLTDPSLHLLTPPSLPTYHNLYHNSFSTLDLSIVSPHLVPISQIWTERDLGSDHFPVVVTLDCSPSVVPFKARRRWRFDPDSWAAFRGQLPSLGETVSVLDVTTDALHFAETVYSASLATFPLSRELVKPQYSKPWWTDSCAAAVLAKRRARCLYTREPTTANLIAFRRCEAVVKKVTREAKRHSWAQFCDRITSTTPSPLVWRRIRRLRGAAPRRTQPLLLNQCLITTPQEKAEAFADHYSRVFGAAPPPTDPTPLLVPLAVALNSGSNHDYNGPFLLSEFSRALSSLPGTSPGSDLVHNKHLQHLPMPYQRWLLAIFNESFRSGDVPAAWKTALLLPLPKPGKPPTSVSSYRPISLLSCVGKLLERLVANRLTFVLERNGALRPSQGGFRQKLSAVDQCARLEQSIRRALASRGVVVALFCDLSSAFDLVWHTGLLYKLSRCGVEGALLAWIRSFLTDRRFRVFVAGETSSSRGMSSGVPQGSVLSPMLFNVMLHDMPSVPGVHAAEYADDITFFSEHKDIHVAAARIQQMLSSFHRWTKRWGFRLNLDKTKCMYFTTKHVAPPPISLAGTVV